MPGLIFSSFVTHGQTAVGSVAGLLWCGVLRTATLNNSVLSTFLFGRVEQSCMASHPGLRPSCFPDSAGKIRRTHQAYTVHDQTQLIMTPATLALASAISYALLSGTMGGHLRPETSNLDSRTRMRPTASSYYSCWVTAYINCYEHDERLSSGTWNLSAQWHLGGERAMLCFSTQYAASFDHTMTTY